MVKNILLICVLGLGIAPVISKAAAAPIFTDPLLTEFLSWESVTANERTFVSEGHGGISVRAYFNSLASPVYHGTQANPFKEGSILAKAVVPNEETTSKDASRVYFMRKMNEGYDPANGNWAYTFAERQNDGTYQFTSQGKLKGCISCHSANQQYDYAYTVKIYSDEHPRVQGLGF